MCFVFTPTFVQVSPSHKYLLNTCYTLASVLGASDTEVNRTNGFLDFSVLTCWWEGKYSKGGIFQVRKKGQGNLIRVPGTRRDSICKAWSGKATEVWVIRRTLPCSDLGTDDGQPVQAWGRNEMRALRERPAGQWCWGQGPGVKRQEVRGPGGQKLDHGGPHGPGQGVGFSSKCDRKPLSHVKQESDGEDGSGWCVENGWTEPGTERMDSWEDAQNLGKKWWRLRPTGVVRIGSIWRYFGGGFEEMRRNAQTLFYYISRNKAL